MTTGERIRQYRLQKEMTLDDLAKKVHATKQTIFKYENGIIKNIPYDRLICIAEALNISPAQIMGWAETSYNKETSILTIPFISQRISAGYGEEELPEECLEVRSIDILSNMAHGISSRTLLAAEVKGDSMIGANIFPEDVIIFSRGLLKGDGIYVLALGGDVVVKRLQFDGLSNTLTIISENPKYQPRTVDSNADGLRILGKVVGWIHKENI